MPTPGYLVDENGDRLVDENGAYLANFWLAIMISEIVADMITACTGISGVKTVGHWTGDVQALLEKPQLMPGVYATYSGAAFGEPVALGGSPAVDARQRFMVLVVTSSLKSSAEAASAAWRIIEAIRARLIARNVAPYGRLWPVSEELVHTDGIIQVYGLDYYMDTRI